MSTNAANGPKVILIASVLMGCILASSACSDRSETRVPLLVIAGPEDFISFEMRSPEGETLWRLEAETPSAIPFVVYAVVPEGFQQTLPATGSPRPLRFGEDLILESRMPNRVFVHQAFANTESTITVLKSEMRRLQPGEKKEPPAAPLGPSTLEIGESD